MPRKKQANPVGRPTKYEGEKTCEKTRKFLAECEDEIVAVEGGGHIVTVKLPSRERLAKHLGVTMPTIRDWEHEYPEFSSALSELDSEQKIRLMERGLGGQYNPTIGKLILSNNHGMAEKKEIAANLTIDGLITEFDEDDDAESGTEG